MMKHATMLLGLVLIAQSAAAQEPLATVRLDAPCRWMDTRTLTEGPLLDGQVRQYEVRDVAECPVGSRIPLDARALLVTVTAVDATGPGYLTLYDATQTSRPQAVTINFAGAAAVSSMAFVALGQVPGPDLAIFARVSGGGSVHVVVDIVGYLLPMP